MKFINNRIEINHKIDYLPNVEWIYTFDKHHETCVFKLFLLHNYFFISKDISGCFYNATKKQRRKFFK